MMEDQLELLKSMTLEQRTQLIENMKEITELIRVCTAKGWLEKPTVEPKYHVKQWTPETERMRDIYNSMTLGGVELIDDTK